MSASSMRFYLPHLCDNRGSFFILIIDDFILRERQKKSPKATAPLSQGQALDKANVVLFGSSDISIKEIYNYVNNTYTKNLYLKHDKMLS